MADLTLEQAYSMDPWEQVVNNERPWFDPLLREIYVRKTVYSQFVTTKVDLNAVKARTISTTDLIPPHATIKQLDARQLYTTPSYMDSYAKDITVARYGNKMALHKESEMFSYWERNGNAGLVPIINQALGQQMVDTFDLLARNTFFRNSYSLFGVGNATGFGGLGSSDIMTTKLIDDVWLGMHERSVPYASLPVNDTPGDLLCITSPGIIYDIKREGSGASDPRLTWVNANMYAQTTALLTGEMGAYRGVRWVENPLAILYNCGEVIHQATISSQIDPGDGAPDPKTTKVDDVRKVGQNSGVRYYIEVNDASLFNVGDMVTLHQIRHDGTNPRGVNGGVDYTDPILHNRRIVAKDTSTTPDRLVFDTPIMETFSQIPSTSIYGYVTKGVHVHTALFLGGGNGVVMGVAQLPQLYTPKPIDDFDSIYRISWDAWVGHTLWEPAHFEMVFLKGPNRIKGPVYRS